MIRFEPYQDGDIDRLVVQPSQAADLADRHWFERVIEGGPVWTMFAPDERVLFVGGFWVHVDEAAKGHATIWCLLSELKGALFVEVTRICRAVIAAARWGRIDMAVDRALPDAARWARLLGLVYEQPLAGMPTHDMYIFQREGQHG